MATPHNPAPPFLCTIFFQHTSGQGWSEGYYCTGANYNDAQSQALNIATARLAMMNNVFSLTYIRTSDPSIRGDSYVRLFNTDFHGTMGDGVLFMDVGTVTVLRVQAGAGKRAPRLLRAVPVDIMSQTSDLYNAGALAAWDTAFAAWVTLVKANTIFYTKAGGGGFTAQTIDSISALRIRNRKIGRPFGLSRGRIAQTAAP